MARRSIAAFIGSTAVLAACGAELPTAADLQGFGWFDRTSLHAAVLAGRVTPGLVKWMVDRRIVRETRGVIFDADHPVFPDGFRQNLNLLGDREPASCPLAPDVNAVETGSLAFGDAEEYAADLPMDFTEE